MTVSNKNICISRLLFSALLSVSVPFSVCAAAQDMDKAIPTQGKPTKITPTPYMPKGAIKTPKKPTSKKEDMRDQEDPFSLLNLLKDNKTEMPQDENFVAIPMEEPDPAGVALYAPNSDFSAQVWGELDREAILARLQQINTIRGSQAIRAKILESLSTQIPLIRTENDSETSALMKARLDALLTNNDYEGFMALLGKLSADVNWENIAQYQTQRALALGKTEEACLNATTQKETVNDFWLKLNAFCEAVKGNRMAVNFHLSVLEESLDVPQAFYKLIDSVLYEAETTPDKALDTTEFGPTLENVPVRALEAAMARITGAKINSISMENAEPFAIPFLLSQPGLSDDAGIMLVGESLKRGWLDQKTLETFVLKTNIADKTPDPQNTQEGDTPAEDLVLPNQNFEYDLRQIKTMLAEDATSAQRIEALNTARMRAKTLGYGQAFYSFYLNFLENTLPHNDVMDHIATFGFTALEIQNYPLANRWFTTARSLPVGQYPEADNALIMLWPYIKVLVDPAPSNKNLSLEPLMQWWQMMAEDEQKYTKGLAIFAALEGVGYRIPNAAWQWLEDGPVITKNKAISTAHWRKFLMAAESPAKIDLYLALATIFETDEPIDPSILGSILATLIEVGEEPLARTIALESVIKVGL